MLKSKRLSLTVTTVQNEKLSSHAIALKHEMCEKIVRNRVKEKRIMKDYSKIVIYFLIKKKRSFSDS